MMLMLIVSSISFAPDVFYTVLEALDEANAGAAEELMDIDVGKLEHKARYVTLLVRLITPMVNNKVVGWVSNERIIVAIYNRTLPGIEIGEFPLVVEETTTDRMGWVKLRLWNPLYPAKARGLFNLTIILAREYEGVKVYHPLVVLDRLSWNDLCALNNSYVEVWQGAVKFRVLTEDGEPLHYRGRGAIVVIKSIIEDKELILWRDEVDMNGFTRWFNFSWKYASATFIPGVKLHIDGPIRDLRYKVVITWMGLVVGGAKYTWEELMQYYAECVDC